jgi:hypothetical protein
VTYQKQGSKDVGKRIRTGAGPTMAIVLLSVAAAMIMPSIATISKAYAQEGTELADLTDLPGLENLPGIENFRIPGSDDTGESPPPPPDDTGQGGVDKFGVQMKYATKSGGEQWFMNMNDPSSDSRFDPQTTLTKNADGSWKVRSDKVRMLVFTSTGYNQDEIETYNQKALATKGYMQSSNDWKNVEITGYVKLNSGSEDTFSWYARGGRHTEGVPCEGTAYKSWLHYDGGTEFAKEQVHPYTSSTSEKSVTESLTGKWIGFKFVMYNFQRDGMTAVKLETWLDPDNDKDFVKVNEEIDSGDWGDDGDECQGSPDQIISWGGPIAHFRWDNADNVDIKWFSVREIKPPVL